ncbi:MAG: hypothetical protein ACI9WT_002260, partial [Flavobacterium sp.]
PLIPQLSDVPPPRAHEPYKTAESFVSSDIS